MFTESIENLTGAVVSALLWDLRQNGNHLGVFPEVRVEQDDDGDFCVALHAGLSSSEEVLFERSLAADYCANFVSQLQQPENFMTEIQNLLLSLESSFPQSAVFSGAAGNDGARLSAVSW